MKLAEIFTDNMILQRDAQIVIFGEGCGKGEIEFCGKTTAFESTEDFFYVYLSPEQAGGPYEMKVTLEGQVQIFKNILMGDVYIAAGQSNMELPLRETVDIEWIEQPQVRMYTEPHEPDDNGNVILGDGVWKECRKENISQFSAIGYDVAIQLQQQTGVPIGVISCNRGASRVDAWTDPELVMLPEYQEMIEKKHIDHRVFFFNQNSWLYLNKLLPIVPYGVKGVLWYQGESNRRTEELMHYDTMLEIMIDNWRALWSEDLPFFLVQCMPFDEAHAEWTDPAKGPEAAADWPLLRQKQAMASKTIDKAYLATLVDTGEENNIHPTKKHEISRMLANGILHHLYGMEREYSGPVWDRAEQSGQEVRITFTHGKGLHFQDGEPRDIYIYDKQGVSYPAQCSIQEDVLVIRKEPDVEVARVTMGYAEVPRHNLYNEAGFWASPFEIIV